MIRCVHEGCGGWMVRQSIDRIKRAGEWKLRWRCKRCQQWHAVRQAERPEAPALRHRTGRRGGGRAYVEWLSPAA